MSGIFQADHCLFQIVIIKYKSGRQHFPESWEALEHYLLRYKLFTNSSLSLDRLALATGINKYHISETLNSYAQRIFYQYINEYRIKYAMDWMEHLQREADPINVLTLAYDAGFKRNLHLTDISKK